MPKMQLQYELDASPHPSLPGYFLVPVYCSTSGEYNVYIADDKARFYTDATLPDCIKAQLGLIRGRGLGPMYMADELFKHEIYNCIDRAIPLLGFHYTPSYYVVVLTKKELQELDTGRTGV